MGDMMRNDNKRILAFLGVAVVALAIVVIVAGFAVGLVRVAQIEQLAGGIATQSRELIRANPDDAPLQEAFTRAKLQGGSELGASGVAIVNQEVDIRQLDAFLRSEARLLREGAAADASGAWEKWREAGGVPVFVWREEDVGSLLTRKDIESATRQGNEVALQMLVEAIAKKELR